MSYSTAAEATVYEVIVGSPGQEVQFRKSPWLDVLVGLAEAIVPLHHRQRRHSSSQISGEEVHRTGGAEAHVLKGVIHKAMVELYLAPPSHRTRVAGPSSKVLFYS